MATSRSASFIGASSACVLLGFFLWGSGVTTTSPAYNLFTSTATATVVNTAAETTLIGAGVGSLTLPAAYFTAGRSIRVVATGIYSTGAVPATLTIKLKAGTTVLASTGAITPTAAAADDFWRVDALVTCRTVGASGTVIVNTTWENTGAALALLGGQMVNTAAVTLDTTTTQAIGLTAQWSAGSNDDSISGTNFYLLSDSGSGVSGGAGNVTTAVTLTSNLPVIGAGGSAIAVGTRSGNTTEYVTSTGSKTTDNCAKWDANDNLVDAGSACGGGSGGVEVPTNFASRPACSTSALFWASLDTMFTSVCNGSSTWKDFYAGMPITRPDAIASWTTVANGQTVTFADTPPGLVSINFPLAANTQYSWMLQALPGATPFTVDITYVATTVGQFRSCGTVVASGTAASSAARIAQYVAQTAIDSSEFLIYGFSNFGTQAGGSAKLTTAGTPALGRSSVTIRYADDGTDRSWAVCSDPLCSLASTVFTEGRTTDFTASHIGVFCVPSTTTIGSNLVVLDKH